MTEEPGFVDRRCPAHSGEYERSCMNMANIDHIKVNCKSTVDSIYEALSKKTPLWTFLPLTIIMLSILSLQWTMFEKMADIHRTIAVLEYKVDNKK